MADGIDAARAAVERGEWGAALELLADDAGGTAGAEALELRAVAAYGAGEFEAAVAAWENLHRLFVAEEDLAAAARAAAMIAMYLMMDTGLMSPVRGWLLRAEQLLEGLDEVPAHALIAMTRTYERFMCGDMETAQVQAERAIELGQRLGVTPAVVIGGVASARVRILNGDLEDGLEQLDGIATLLMAGGADPLTTGMMYCELICAAQGLALYDRAREWTEVMEHWRHGAAFGGINGRCRVHRAEMMRVSGPCAEAEAEALLACEELRPWMRREFGWPLAELGTIRLRKGDLEGAAAALNEAHGHAWSPHPGMALVRLEQGDPGAALALIVDSLEHPIAIPSKERPPYGDLWMAPLLDAQSEIASAAVDPEMARDAAERLRSIADDHPGPGLEAGALLARARAALLDDDPATAVTAAREAAALWAGVGAPYEGGTARLVLGDALERAGNTPGAQLEWRAALAAFRSYGAERRARLTADRLDAAPTRRPATVAARVEEVTASFRLDGDHRIAEIGGGTASMQDLVGFRYIGRLLAEPGREFHALDLVAVEQGTLRPERTAASQSGLPALDDQARRAYQRRLVEIEADIDDATLANDLGRIELAERDRAYLVAELERAVGLSGRTRKSGGSSERARTSVTRSIRYALSRLDDHHPVLAGHLQNCLRTGTYCSYQPDPARPVTWIL